MRRAALALALLAATPAAARADFLNVETATPAPAWKFQPDKAVHAGVSFGLSGALYATARVALHDRTDRQARIGSAVVGLGATLLIGAGKELIDLRVGDPSALDFAADACGAVLGTGIALIIDFGVKH